MKEPTNINQLKLNNKEGLIGVSKVIGVGGSLGLLGVIVMAALGAEHGSLHLIDLTGGWAEKLNEFFMILFFTHLSAFFGGWLFIAIEKKEVPKDKIKEGGK